MPAHDLTQVVPPTSADSVAAARAGLPGWNRGLRPADTRRLHCGLANSVVAVTSMLDGYELFMGSDLITYLCVWREAAQKHLANRAKHAAGVTPIGERRAG